MNKTTDKAKKTAYGYARVSTNKQEAHGYSLEAQREQIERYCEQNDIELLGFYSETESGSLSARPKLLEVLNLSELSNSILIIAKIDRLTRSLKFLTELQAHNTPFIALDMPEANPTMLQVMVSFAEYENRLRSIRTKEGLAKAKAKGVKLGAKGKKNLQNYYKQIEKRVDPKGRANKITQQLKGLKKSDPKYDELLQERSSIEEAIRYQQIKPASDKKSEMAQQRARSILPYIEACKEEGHTSYRQIAKCLTDKRIKTPTGKDQWNVGNVQTLMKQIDRIEA